MRLRQLHCFVRVCELGSISRAANELNIAQPALGLQVRGLEHDFGVELVVRSARGVKPTPAGELVLEHSRALIQQDRELRVRLKEMNNDEPVRLTLALTASLVHLIVGSVIEKMRTELPDIRLEIMEGASELIAQWVEQERTDIGLGFGLFSAGAVQATPILKERLFYLSAPGDSESTISLTEVLARPLALPNEQNSIRHIVEAAAKTLELPVVGTYEFASLDANRSIARGGTAGAIVPYGGIVDDVARGELSARMIVEPELERTLYIWRRNDHPVSSAERLMTNIIVDALRSACNKVPAGTYLFLDDNRVGT